MIPLLLCIFLLYFQCVFSSLITVTESILSENVEMCAIWISNEFTDTRYSKYAL